MIGERSEPLKIVLRRAVDELMWMNLFSKTGPLYWSSSTTWKIFFQMRVRETCFGRLSYVVVWRPSTTDVAENFSGESPWPD